MTAIDLGKLQDDEALMEEAAPSGPEAIGLGVSEAAEAAFAGELSPQFIREYYENDKLKPKHMKMLRMAVAGYSNNQIAEYMEYTPARVSVILNHQDARTIMARMVGEASGRLDVDKRLKAIAPEMLETVIAITRTTHDNRLRSRNAFELLGRAGFGATQKVDVKLNQTVSVAPALMQRLTSAMEEANALRSEAYDPMQRKLAKAAEEMIVIVVEETGSASRPNGLDGPGVLVNPETLVQEAEVPQSVAAGFVP